LYNLERNEFCDGLGEPITLVAQPNYVWFEFVALTLKQCFDNEPYWFTEACIDRGNTVFKPEVVVAEEISVIVLVAEFIDHLLASIVHELWIKLHQRYITA
jgi:hypothetical protein